MYTKAEPPEIVKDAPAHAIAIFVAAWNSAYESRKGSDAERERYAFAVANAAVHKAGYHKDADGKWTRSSQDEMDEALIADAVDLATLEELTAQAEARAEKYGIGVKEGGARTPPKGFPTDEAEYGDPVNWAYPLAPVARVKAAESYYNHEGMMDDGGYTAEEWAVIGKRIAAACSKALGAKYECKGGKVVHVAESSEPDFVAQDEGRLVTLHALAEQAPAEDAGDESVSVVEIACVGDYTDAHGKDVSITEERIDRMVANFEANAAGQDIPIDVMHEKREAGGWLQRVWRDGKKFMGEVSWNGMGKRLVGDKVYRYLSASIAMPTWVLRSVSLVNFPAIKGLAPVELSEWLLSQSIPNVSQEVPKVTKGDPPAGPRAAHTASQNARQRGGAKTGGSNMADEKDLQEQETQTAQPASAPDVASLAEFQAALQKAKDDAVSALSEQIVSELAQKREEMLANLREEMADERALSEFVMGATAKGEHALPVRPDDLTAVLRELPKPQRTKVMDLLRQVAQAGTVDMREIGTSAKGDDKRQLEPEMVSALRSFVNTGGSPELFFKANPELGKLADYDLTELGG
jgi:cation transport regulator ChaB